MNNLVLIGNLVRNPELKYTQGGTARCNFTLAVSRGLSKEKKAEAEQKKQPTADFISCICWGKTAELIGRYFNKGSQIAIQGRIQTGSYEANDGTRRYTTDVVVDRFDFIDNKKEEGKYNIQNEDMFPVSSDDIPF